MSIIALYATDTMADWEYAYLTAGLTQAAALQPGRYRLKVVADGAKTVTTMGGLRLLTDGELGDLEAGGVDAGELAALILPGSETWEDGHERVLDLARQCVAQEVPVAAICGATYGLARAGLLDDRRHTSNAPEYLAGSGDTGGARYAEERVVRDGPVITAPATRPVDFAAEIFRTLDLFPPSVIDAWYGLYTTGEKRYFDQLTASAG